MVVSATSNQSGRVSVTVASKRPGVVQLVHSHKAATQKATLMAFPLVCQCMTSHSRLVKQQSSTNFRCRGLHLGSLGRCTRLPMVELTCEARYACLYALQSAVLLHTLHATHS